MGVGAGGGASTPGRTKFRSPTRGTAAGLVEAASTQVAAEMKEATRVFQQALSQITSYTTAVLDSFERASRGAVRDDLHSLMQRFEDRLQRGKGNGNFAPARFCLGELRKANAPDYVVQGYQDELDGAEAAYANRPA